MSAPQPYWTDGQVSLYGADALAVLAALPTGSVGQQMALTADLEAS